MLLVNSEIASQTVPLHPLATAWLPVALVGECSMPVV
jgi:hypothetical protein